MPGRRGLLTAMLTLSLVLVAGFALKAPCLFNEWGDTQQFQYRTYCYSDVAGIYHARGLDEDRVPYAQEFSEYPVVTAFTMWAMAMLTDTLAGYFFVTAMILIAAAYGATLALWRSGVGVPRILVWSASPALVAHAFTNWDLIAVALAAIGWMRWRERDALQAGLFFGLGGAAKVYPAFFLPFLLLALLRARDRRAAGRLVAGGALGLGVPNLLVMLVAFDGWLAMWRFQLAAQGARESPWVLLDLLGLPDIAIAAIGIVILVAAVAATAWLVWRRGMDPLVAGALITLAFLLVNRFYSPQFTLWALPLLAALAVPWGRVIAFTLADVAVFLVRYQVFTTPADQAPGTFNEAWRPWLAVASSVRWLLLAACAWWILRAYARGRSDEPGSGLEDERGPADLWATSHPEA